MLVSPIRQSTLFAQTTKLVKKDCGKHYGHAAGPCSKCTSHDSNMSRPEYRLGVQSSGTPWNAVIS